MTIKLGFIGGGNMASSLIGGLVPHTITANNIIVFNRGAEKAKVLQQQFGITIAKSNEEIIRTCDVVVIAVKPQVVKSVIEPLKSEFVKHKPLIISVAAGIQSSTIEQWLGQALPLVRVMPNTPSLVGAGISGMYANAQVNEDQKQITQTLMNAVGSSVWVDNEADIDSVTALSGSGPAYFLLFIKSLSDAAITSGLEPQTAKKLAIETARGAAMLAQQSELSLTQLIENVTSPGGTTEQALNTLHQNNIPSILTDAFNSARDRSEELALELSDTKT